MKNINVFVLVFLSVITVFVPVKANADGSMIIGMVIGSSMSDSDNQYEIDSLKKENVALKKQVQELSVKLEAVKVAIGISEKPVIVPVVVPDSTYTIAKTNVITGRNGSFMQYVLVGDRGGSVKITKREIDDSSVSLSKAKGFKVVKNKAGQVKFKAF
jgi:hypothetical protein